MAIVVHQSSIKAWRKCRRAYHYKYVDGLRKKAPSRPLQFGTIVHELHEELAAGRDPFKKLDEIAVKSGSLFLEEVEEYGNLIEDIEVIMREYTEHYKNDEMAFVKMNGQYTEHDFKVPIDEGIVLSMRIDGIVKSKGLRWLLEHKNHKAIPAEDERWRNLQTVMYLRALDEIGIRRLDGVVWNYIRTKPPTKPKLLKNGALSKRKIDTLPTVIRRVISEHGLKEKNYQDLIQRATINRESYFVRAYTPINKRAQDEIFRDALHTAHEMRKNHGIKKERSIDLHCGWCDFEPLCRASLTGADVKFVKERQYVKEKVENPIDRT